MPDLPSVGQTICRRQVGDGSVLMKIQGGTAESARDRQRGVPHDG